METTKIKMNMDGTIRAKVLQYKSDGNTLIEKWETLKKYAEGVYYYLTPDNYGGEYCNIVLEINGVFWKNNTTSGNVFCIGHYAHKQWDNEARTVVATFPDIVRKNSELGRYINNLQIEVMRRLGHDVADLQAAHDEYIRQREERERQRAEEAERRERERMEAEERRKAEVLADGKEKLLNHERITVEQIELIAEAVGYKINIRTIGFIREKVTGAVVSDNGLQVFGYKLTSRNIDGTAKVMHEIYDRIKAQVEEEAEQPEQATEAPQISTETAETVNVSAEGEKEAERAENKPKRKIQYFHYTPEQLKRYIIDVYEKRANGEWVLLPYEQIDTDKCFWNVINGKIGEWDRMQEKFIEVNMDFNSPTCGRCFKINRTYQQDYFIVSNEKLLEFTINGNYYYIQKQTYSKGKHKWCYTIMDAHGDFAVDDFSYTKRGIMQRFNKWWKKNATIIWQASETPTQPPQSPKTPQTVDCATDTPKPRETARKPQNRGIGNTRHSRLGANGYAMLDNASATLTAMYVPRECSTADAAYW